MCQETADISEFNGDKFIKYEPVYVGLVVISEEEEFSCMNYKTVLVNFSFCT